MPTPDEVPQTPAGTTSHESAQRFRLPCARWSARRREYLHVERPSARRRQGGPAPIELGNRSSVELVPHFRPTLGSSFGPARRSAMSFGRPQPCVGDARRLTTATSSSAAPERLRSVAKRRSGSFTTLSSRCTSSRAPKLFAREADDRRRRDRRGHEARNDLDLALAAEEALAFREALPTSTMPRREDVGARCRCDRPANTRVPCTRVLPFSDARRSLPARRLFTFATPKVGDARDAVDARRGGSAATRRGARGPERLRLRRRRASCAACKTRAGVERDAQRDRHAGARFSPAMLARTRSSPSGAPST